MSAQLTSLVWKRLNNLGQSRFKQLNAILEKQSSSISKITKKVRASESKPDVSSRALSPADNKEVIDKRKTKQKKVKKRKLGSVRLYKAFIPTALQDAVTVVMNNHPVTDLVKNSEKMRSFLKERKRNITPKEFDLIVEKNIVGLRSRDALSGKLKYNEIYEEQLKERAIKKAEESFYWMPMKYTGYKVFQYLAARLGGDYSSLLACLTEIKIRDRNFSPHSMLDFGSGLATSVWASTSVWKNILEYYCVDHSSDMNTVARLLLQDGREDMHMKVPVNFTNKLPSDFKFDLVISTYTLTDIETEEEREKLIESLWNRTEKYLVIIEHGSLSGFTLINETRQHLLKLSKQSKEGHIFSPCPHHEPCPKLKEKYSPCYFETTYADLEQMEPERLEKEYYSFIIFKVGPKPITEVSFPRIVDEPYKMKSCTHCHLCCSDGKLFHAVINPQAHGETLYKSSRLLLWGDMLPIQDEQLSENNNVISEGDDMLPIQVEQLSENNDVISEGDDMLPIQDEQLSENNNVISEGDDMLPIQDEQLSENDDVTSEGDDMLPVQDK